MVRGIRRNRRAAGYVPEVIKPNRAKPAKSYARFQEKNTNRVIVADFKLKEGNKERYHYEFAGNEFFDSLAEAERARQASLQAYLDVPGKYFFNIRNSHYVGPNTFLNPRIQLIL